MCCQDNNASRVTMALWQRFTCYLDNTTRVTTYHDTTTRVTMTTVVLYLCSMTLAANQTAVKVLRAAQQMPTGASF